MNDVIPTGSTETNGEPPASPGAERTQRRVRAAADALRALIRDLYDTEHGVAAPAAPPLDLAVVARVHPAEGWRIEFEPPLAEQLRDQLATLEGRVGVYREGAVYCFRCESAACAHAEPPSPLSVFAGYDAVGLPEWLELSRWLLARNDPRAADLYNPPARPLAATAAGRELRHRQLPEFGRSSRAYSILGQVAAGYFRHTGSEDPADRFALTFQVVETLGPGARRELRLNTVGRLPNSAPLDEWLVGERGVAVARAREAARRALAQIALEAAAARAAGPAALRRALARIPALLRRLADSIERGERQLDRRTRHAERRRREHHRPVHKAFEDAAQAGPTSWYRDERAGTVVVCGPQGRAHVFADDGRHVTSFVLPPGGEDFRVRTARWSPLPEEDIARLRAAIRGSQV
ncbi:MAG: hypothetical protein N2652_06875 [Kiritimatiellae bacterium]|nr:hypothetical protein [Kiritimatiellia bacterium]